MQIDTFGMQASPAIVLLKHFLRLKAEAQLVSYRLHQLRRSGTDQNKPQILERTARADQGAPNASIGSSSEHLGEPATSANPRCRVVKVGTACMEPRKARSSGCESR